MRKLLNFNINLSFFTNPFYLYCITFLLSVFLYLWGWSDLYPGLSLRLLLFLASSFLLFILVGRLIERREYLKINGNTNSGGQRLSVIIFFTIIVLGCINVLQMGYLPIMDTSKNYHEFGVAVLDPLFNTLSIFFSVFFFHLFLKTRNLRYTGFVILILLFQVLIFRRSTIVWTLTSVTFCYLLYNPTIKLKLLLAAIIIFPIVSYSFGLYGNFRGNLTKSFILDELGASKSFKESGINHEHYITYLYVSSPLANLQKNVNEGAGLINNGDIESFLLYCIMPQSITLRLQKPLKLVEPECSLISGNLIVGTFYMVGFYTFGWIGLILMSLFLLCIILIAVYIIRKWNIFNLTVHSILLTTVSLLIFANFLNRLDVLLMLFIYPPLFHLVYANKKIIRFLEPSGRVASHNNFSD